MENSADILGSPPSEEQLTRAERQAQKKKRRAILCLQCSTDKKQVFHDLPEPKELLASEKLESKGKG
jgi:hypothetical protein